MVLTEIKKTIDKKLDAGLVSGRVLLDNLIVIDEDSRKTAAYCDHRYAPFYYYLGNCIKPVVMVEFGFTLGLMSCSFLKSCKSVKQFVGFYKKKPDETFSARLGEANLKRRCKGSVDIYIGTLSDDEFSQKFSPKNIDLAILTDEAGYDQYLEYFDFTWEYLADNGLIVADNLVRYPILGTAFADFCKGKNREGIKFKTRYGIGIVQK